MSGSAAAVGASVTTAAEETVVVAEDVVYSGIVTRGIAVTLDVLVVNGIAIVVAAAWALVSSIIPGSQKLHTLEVAIAALVYAVWVFAYFSTFWSTTGQTPGDRVMHIRVVHPDGSTMHWVRAATRFAASIVAAIPLFAGYLPILFSPRRRAVNDWVADTVVVRFEPLPSADARTHVAHGPGGPVHRPGQ